MWNASNCLKKFKDFLRKKKASDEEKNVSLKSCNITYLM